MNMEQAAILGSQAAPTEETPDISWSVDRLAKYADGQVTISVKAQALSIHLGHNSVAAVFRAGKAYAFIRDKKKEEGHGAWGKWKKEGCRKNTTVNDAIRLWENAKYEERLKGMNITTAKTNFVYPKQNKPKPETSKRQPSPETKAQRLKDSPAASEDKPVVVESSVKLATHTVLPESKASIAEDNVPQNIEGSSSSTKSESVVVEPTNKVASRTAESKASASTSEAIPPINVVKKIEDLTEHFNVMIQAQWAKNDRTSCEPAVVAMTKAGSSDLLGGCILYGILTD